MKQRMQRFMAGRYGADQLGQLYLGVSMVLLVVSLFSRWNIFYAFALALMGYEYYRMLSRQVEKRYQENQKFLTASQPVRKWLGSMKQRFHDRKTHRYFSCPNCGMTLRVPRGKGKINISCPKCRTQFIKKT